MDAHRHGVAAALIVVPQDLHRAFQDAFNRHDVEAVVELYEPDAVVISGTGPVRGVDAIREMYRGVFTMLPTLDIQTLALHIVGDLAMLQGRWTWRGTAADGSAIQREGRSVETVRRQTDGRWLFVIDNPSV